MTRRNLKPRRQVKHCLNLLSLRQPLGRRCRCPVLRIELPGASTSWVLWRSNTNSWTMIYCCSLYIVNWWPRKITLDSRDNWALFSIHLHRNLTKPTSFNSLYFLPRSQHTVDSFWLSTFLGLRCRSFDRRISLSWNINKLWNSSSMLSPRFILERYVFVTYTQGMWWSCKSPSPKKTELEELFS